MMLVFSVFINMIWQCSCFPSKNYAVPVIDSQKAPLVAIVDTGKIVQQIVESLGEPVEEFVNKTVDDRANIIMKQKVSEFEQRLNKMEQNLRLHSESEKDKISSIKKEINDAKRIVAMTSCLTSVVSVKAYAIVRFPDLATSYGISKNTMDSFKQTGKFTCEIPGLYMVTTSIMSFSSLAQYNIYIGTKYLRRVQVSPTDPNDKKNDYHTGTGSVVVMLGINATVYIKAGHRMTIYGGKYSCITVLKIN